MSDPQAVEKTHAPSAVQEGMSTEGGLSRKAPAFSLSADAPVQRQPGFGGTNRRLDQNQYQASDLEDPEALARLNAMSAEQLRALLPIVRDTAVQDFITQRIAHIHVPPAGRIHHEPQTLLPADLALKNELRIYMEALPARMQALIANPPANLQRLQNNANAANAIATTRQAAAELSSTTRNIVFMDALPASGRNNVAASYDYINNTINLRRFHNTQERANVASSMTHEFTHAQQDAAEERALIESLSGRHGATRAEDYAHEYGGWRVGSYVTAMLMGLGDLEFSFGNALEALVSNDYDRVQSGSRRERRVAEASIRSTLDMYSAQFDHNQDIVNVRINIEGDNHASMDFNGSPVDLGEIPAAMNNPFPLQGFLRDRILALPNAVSLLEDRHPRRRYNQITFLVRFRETRITEFGLMRSEFPRPARP